MSGDLVAHDEWFTYTSDDGGTTTNYRFMLAPRSALSNVSSSPFAPKSVFGDRSYGDYDAISAIAMTDFSGGMGQERFTDTTLYYTTENVDTRGGSLILGPRVSTISQVFPVTVTGTVWQEIWADLYTSPQDQITKVASKYIPPAGVTSVRGVWLYLKADAGCPEVTVKLSDNNNTDNVPNAMVAVGKISAGSLSAYGAWKYVPFIAPAVVTPNAVYWVNIENTSDSKAVYWLRDTATPINSAFHRTDGWVQEDGDGAFWAEDYRQRPTAPVVPFIGTGADNIARVWLRSSGSLYYVSATPTAAPVLDATTGSAQLLAAEILSHAWFRAPDDTSSWLYCAIGDDNDMVRFNGYIRGGAAPTGAWTVGATYVQNNVVYNSANRLYSCTTAGAGVVANEPTHTSGDATLADGYVWTFVTSERWETQTSHKARCLCTHDKYLVYAYDRNNVDCFDGTTWGGSAVEVGDRNYVVLNMVSWNGAVWIGKADGLYKLTIPAGYPTGVTLTCEKIIDFLPLADADNFSLMLVHKGDLWFNIGNGLMQYTLSVGSSASVLNSVAPDTALNISASKRQTFRAGVSILGALWLLAEGTVTPDVSAGVTVGNSRLYCYTEGHWYAVCEFAGVQALPVRGICVEPGWYGEHPRLWFGKGWLASYIEMPTNTTRRWLVPSLTYHSTGYWYSSWFDGNIRTVEKDWMRVEVVTSNSGIGAAAGVADTVVLDWRPDEQTAWAQLGAPLAYNADNAYVEFPVNSHSHKCQLRVRLTNTTTGAAPYTTTPRVEAIVVKYMERPADIRSHTRTYRLADRLENRNGAPVTRSLAQQLDDLRTLRQASEPLTWRPWYSATTRNVHIVDYSVSEMPDEERGTGDKGAMVAIVRLQEI